MQTLFGFLCCYVPLCAALAISNPPPASGPGGGDLTAPPPKAGESADQYVAQLFGPLDVTPANVSLSARARSLGKRDLSAVGQYREYYGIHELAWDNETAHTSYNFSIDLSNACTGLKLNSTVGLYTFANGTTKSKASLNDIVADVWSLAPTPSDRRRRWLNHTNVLAQTALAEANTLLNSGMICENYTATQVLALVAGGSTPATFNPVHDELRHLLHSKAWSYWAAAIMSTGGSAAIGASLAGGIQYAFTGNVTAQNVVQTGTVVGITVLLGSFFMRSHEVGRINRIVDEVNRRAELGREAVLQNTFIARFRDIFQTIHRQRTWEDGTNGGLGGFSVGAQTNAGSTLTGGMSHPGTPGDGSSRPFRCLSDTDAVYAIQALGQMSSVDMNLRMLSSIQDIEMERMMNGDAGSSAVGSSQLYPSRPESSHDGVGGVGASTSGGRDICRELVSSSQVSFRTATEANAQDLVEMGNPSYDSTAGSESASVAASEAGTKDQEEGAGKQGGSGSGSSGSGSSSSGSSGSGSGSSGAGETVFQDKGKGRDPNWDGSF